MSNLIMQADVRVQETRAELEEFIEDIEEQTGSFTESAENDSRELDGIKQVKTQFFNRMKSYQEELSAAVAHLRVYPDSFQSLCEEIDSLLVDLERTHLTMTQASANIEENLEAFRARRDALLAEAGLSSWEIHNGPFKDLVKRFTITSHKVAAGKIAGFDVETPDQDSVASGDVTLFF